VFTDGSTSEFGNNLLARGFNAFTAIEKINQSGAEGFFKNAARQLQANFSKEARMDEIARMMGVKVQEISDAFQAVGRDLNSQFDSFMVTQDVDVNALTVSMPNPQEFFDCCLQEACASLGGFPATELTGHMTGDRSSSENNKVMAQLATSRRANVLDNDIEDFFKHLSDIGCFKGAELSTRWVLGLVSGTTHRKRFAPSQEWSLSQRMDLRNCLSLSSNLKMASSSNNKSPARGLFTGFIYRLNGIPN